MGIPAGNLDRRITVRGPVPTQNTFGEVVYEFGDLFKAWARLLPQGGGESFTADQRSSRSTVRFEVRKRAGYEPRLRVLLGTQVYEIDSVSEPDRNDRVVLECHSFEVKVE